jgi:hypothetical protein
MTTTNVRFEWKYEGQQVELTGSFVAWNEKIALHKENDIWVTTVPLKPGEYHFKYVIDGNHWYYDMAKDHKEDSTGNINNFIIVAEPKVEVSENTSDNTYSSDPLPLTHKFHKSDPLPLTLKTQPLEPLSVSLTNSFPSSHTLNPPRTLAQISRGKSTPELPHLMHSDTDMAMHRTPRSENIDSLYKTMPNLLNDSYFEPKVTSNVSPHKKLKFQRTKFNSTASLYIDAMSIIIDPDLEKTLRCKSIALHWMMRDHATKPQKLKDIYSEDYYKSKLRKEEQGLGSSSSSSSPDIPAITLPETDVPSTEVIFLFLKQIYHNAQIPAEVAIMALAYIERFLTLTDITLHICNWRLICLGAIMVARKVWVDKSRISNVNFLRLFNYMTIDDLAHIEREYLSSLQYTVSLKPSIYAKYYFALCSIAEMNETNFPLKPLSREDEERLETLSHPNSERIISRPRRRSISVNFPKQQVQAVGGE